VKAPGVMRRRPVEKLALLDPSAMLGRATMNRRTTLPKPWPDAANLFRALRWQFVLPVVLLLPVRLPAAAQFEIFARSNLVSWCILPFDTKKRGPEERGQMLEQLGIKKLAYDWRAEHLPTFDAEVAAMKRHGVDLAAWWFPGALNAEARAILDCIKRNDIHPQLWVMLEGGPHLRFDQAFESTAAAQAAHVARMVAGVKPLAAEAAKLGSEERRSEDGDRLGEPQKQNQM
jgi:hypothetical protein